MKKKLSWRLAAQNTSPGANDSRKAPQQLAQMWTQLRELVGQF
ncbi:MAG TPA: hypothetical protein VED66_10580 [Candidatus Sulfotelmatobacter sp.]|nr:hypothetical protein [Candidatus Sulfotelmatobacter sp.]